MLHTLNYFVNIIFHLKLCLFSQFLIFSNHLSLWDNVTYCLLTMLIWTSSSVWCQVTSDTRPETSDHGLHLNYFISSHTDSSLMNHTRCVLQTLTSSTSHCTTRTSMYCMICIPPPLFIHATIPTPFYDSTISQRCCHQSREQSLIKFTNCWLLPQVSNKDPDSR